ncbi:MAG: Ig-like domain-containing protein [Pseudobdellovibrionaceae bacterium]
MGASYRRQLESMLAAFLCAPLITVFVGCSYPISGDNSKIYPDYNPGVTEPPLAVGAPTATGVTASFDEDTMSSDIVLSYTAEANAEAQICTISNLLSVSITQACACTSGVCTLKVQGTSNYNGAASFRYRVTDQKGRLSNSALGDLTINPVNDAPVLAAISSQSATAGQALVVNLSAQDVDSFFVCGLPGTFVVTSDNAGVIPSSNVIFGGTAPNCTATITPISNQRGTVSLQFTLSDGALTSAQSFAVSVTSPPSAPTSLAATSGGSQVDLTWTASASGYAPITYTVFRSTTSGLGYAALAACTNLSANNCTDTTVVNGTTYYYVVRANNVDGTSGNSNEASALPISLPSAPTLSLVITQAARLDLSWASSTGTGPITYTLMRSTTSGNSYASVAGCVGLSTTTCNDTSVTVGTTYFYIVTATNGGGNTSSNEVSAVPMAGFTIGLTPGNRQIQASFSSVGATSYSVQYGTSVGSYSTTVSGATSPATISNLVNGTTYYFMVTANNGAGSIMATAEVSSAPNGPQLFNISTATEGNGQVDLTWGISAGATSYSVRYGTSTGSYPTTFATGLVGTTNTVTGLTNGTTYYFMVTAENADGSQDATAEFVRTPAQPTLSAINNQTAFTQGSSWSVDIPFTLGGFTNFTCNGTVVATSSDTSFVANGALTLSGTVPSCNLNIAVGASQIGNTTITLTATHGSATATRAFAFQSTVWNPSALSPALWLDASDASSITASVGRVSEWRDKSGNIRHAKNSNPATQPSYSATGLGGKPALVYPASANNYWLRTPAYSWATSRQFANFIVANLSSQSPFLRLFTYEPPTGQNISNDFKLGFIGLNSGGNAALAITGTANTSMPIVAGFTVASGARIISNVFGTAGVAADVNAIALDGGSFASRASNSGAISTGGSTIGAQGGGVYSWRGSVAEIVQISGPLSVTNRQRIEGYLAWKWGLSSKLPVGHPHKASPP